MAQERSYVFVSDYFLDDLQGGAEFSLEALMETFPTRVVRIRSDCLRKADVRRYEEATWVFGNFYKIATSRPHFLSTLARGLERYFIVESDFKFCTYRNLDRHFLERKQTCDCPRSKRGRLVTRFIEGATHCFFRSSRQRETHLKMLELDRSRTSILSCVFSRNFFSHLPELQKIEKLDYWVVPGSTNWVKGSADATNWCRDQGFEVRAASGLDYSDALKLMAQARGFCLLPRGADTCPRMTVEARLLGCQLHLNEHVLHRREPWFSETSTGQLEEYLRRIPQLFWGRVSRDVAH